MKSWFTAAELAGAPGMPTHERHVRRVAQRDRWQSRPRASVGGRPAVEYSIASLPQETRDHLIQAAVAALPATDPASAAAPSSVVVPLPRAAAARSTPAAGAAAQAEVLPALPARDVRTMKDFERQAAMARMTIIKRIGELRDTLHVSLELAIKALNDSVQANPEDTLARLLATANARLRKGRPPMLTKATFYRWQGLEAAAGYAGLAPLPTHREQLPAWAPALLRLYQRPTKPSLADCLRQLPAALTADGVAGAAPTYAQARNFVKNKVGAVALQVGRMGPRDLRTRLPFVRRSFDDLKPGDIYTSDGHTFKAQIQHPDRPGAFRPEVTPVLDVATRKCVGVSISLAENQYDVLAALKHAFATHGVCAIFYVDRGPGFNNALQKDTLVGMGPRLGYRVEHSIPFNSQARGVIERFHSSVLVPLARRLETGIPRGADKEHLQKVHKLVTKAQRQHGVRTALPTFDEFVAALRQAIDDYNARAHRSLKGVSPGQRWEQSIASGWQVCALGDDIERDLFWPQVVATVRRGEIRFRGKTYFSLGLTEYDGDKVLVGYDIHDPTEVVVRDLERRWICAAQLDGNVRPYYPMSVVQERRIERAEAQLKRVDRKRGVVLDELDRATALTHQPGTPATFLNDFTPEEALPAPVAARPVFQFQADRYEWLMAHRDAWAEDDRPWVERFIKTELYQQLIDRWEMLGIAWRDGGEAPSFKAAD